MPGKHRGFANAEMVASYADSAPKSVPGYHDLHTMASVLLAERTPADGHVLVLGAGGGLEVKALATAHPHWRFQAVDPSEAMMELATATLGPLAERMDTHIGYVDDAPEGPFDAATALLLLHLTERDERLRTLTEVHRRLRPGAPLVVMHVSFDQDDPAERQRMIDRHLAYLLANGNDPAHVDKAGEMIREHMPALSPEQDHALLEDVGFTDVTQFFSAFTFRGWVGYAQSSRGPG
ncbi:methyltransferase [Mycolicibacterium sp. (ex Dasyatis americana)]|nr:methyltransferase [Mycolicibacterium sp. (ex Dasyatis americana)]